jgi:polar amino acid transport system substrate-binding protein
MKRLIVFSLLFSLVNLTALYAEEVEVVANESMPFNGIVDGKNVGMTYDILQEAMKYGAPKFTYKFGLPWNRAQQMIKDAGDKPIAIVPFTRTAKREPNFKWIAELIAYNARLSVYKRPAVTIEEAKKLKVGMLRESSNISLLQSFGITQFDYSQDALTNAKKLAAGRFQILGETKYVDTYAWKKAGMDPKDLKFTEIGEKRYIYIAANLNFPPKLSKQISDAIDKMRSNGRLKAILESWQ